MGRAESPCGTVSAYKRHLRRNETPCDPCRDAKRNAQRDARKLPGAITNKVDADTDDLMLIMDTLRSALVAVADSAPDKIAPIAREFRAAIAAASEPADKPREMSLADQLAEARAARATRASG